MLLVDAVHRQLVSDDEESMRARKLLLHLVALWKGIELLDLPNDMQHRLGCFPRVIFGDVVADILKVLLGRGGDDDLMWRHTW